MIGNRLFLLFTFFVSSVSAHAMPPVSPFKVPSQVIQTAYTLSLHQQILEAHPNLPSDALLYALAIHEQVKYTLANPTILTLIDYTQSSRDKRMFLINLQSLEVQSYLVAHGKNSVTPGTTGDIPGRFSNIDGSLMSSKGFFLTNNVYYGKHGRSLELIGLEKSNSNAYFRKIVIHGASYVSDAIAKTAKRLGLSWGCPAVDYKYSDHIIDQIKNGSLLYIFGH